MTALYRAPEHNDELYDQMARDFMSDGLVVARPHNTHIIIIGKFPPYIVHLYALTT